MADGRKHCMPKLRFLEFKKGGEWNLCPLGSMTTKIGSGVTPRGGESNYLPSGIPFVRSQNVGWGELILNNIAFIPYEIHKTLLSTEIKNCDVLLNITGASIGRCAIVNKNISGGNVNQHVCIIRPKKEKLNSFFLMQYIISQQGQKQIDSYQAGGNRQGLNFAQVALINIPLPSLPEQQKIADCLSSLDELIQAHEQKRDALVEHKKGLMQRLFPAEGENTPPWRFPEFRKANAWEQKSLGQVCKTFSGGTPSTSNKAYYGGDIPFIRSAEINETKTELFLTELGLKNSSAKLVKEGDILLALYGANSGEVAISKMSGAINQAILCLRSTQNDFFIFHYLFFKKDYFISKYLQGGQGNFSAEIVKAIFIPLPSIPEQQKIADCLSSLDARIEAEEAKIASLREHKQGLMQQLFPQSL